MSGEFIHVTLLSVVVWWVPSTGALVSNAPPQAGRVLCTTRVLYRYSAFVGGSMHPYAHDTGKTLAGKRYVMRPRYGPIPANSICCVFVFVTSTIGSIWFCRLSSTVPVRVRAYLTV